VNVLVVTSMYPSDEAPVYGAVVHEQIDSLRALGLSVDILKIGGAIAARTRNVTKYVYAVTVLRRTIAAAQPDVIHAHDGLSGAIASYPRRHDVPRE
jgi:hypothetical protein